MNAVEEGGGLFFKQEVRGGIFHNVMFEQRLKGSEEISHANIWVEDF